MRSANFVLILLIALWLPQECSADEPATKFYVIETAKLAKLAETDAAIDTLTSPQLSEISIATGWYVGTRMILSTEAFRMDARFSGSVPFAPPEPASIDYNIGASKDRTSWSILSTRGTATRQGKQFITKDWRKQSVTVVLRHLNLRY